VKRTPLQRIEEHLTIELLLRGPVLLVQVHVPVLVPVLHGLLPCRVLQGYSHQTERETDTITTNRGTKSELLLLGLVLLVLVLVQGPVLVLTPLPVAL